MTSNDQLMFLRAVMTLEPPMYLDIEAQRALQKRFFAGVAPEDLRPSIQPLADQAR
jgi:hypothetical protein